VLSTYAARLDAVGGRLYLSGVGPELVAQFTAAGRVRSEGPLRLQEATPVVGESSHVAYEAAEAWLIGHPGDEVAADPAPPPPARTGDGAEGSHTTGANWFRRLRHRGD
jgi:SulP family sulfate permease